MDTQPPITGSAGTRLAAAFSRFAPKYLYALLASPFLFTIGTLSRRHRFLIFEIAQHFGFKMQVEHEELPVLPLAQVLPAHLDLQLLEPKIEGGNVSLLELLVISNLARRAAPPVCLEIGTFDGRTTLNLAANLPAEGHVFTIDLPKTSIGGTQFELAPGEATFVDKETSGERFRDTPFKSKITQLFGDSAVFDFSPYHRKIGLVFVDGSHAFDYVLKDSATALQLASDDQSIILWHDYHPGWPDVIRALNHLRRSDPTFAGLQRIEGTSLAILMTAAKPRLP
jgi:hypothetical protein